MTLEAQIEALKAENAFLRKENAELKALLHQALDQLNKNSRNSSKPPSTDQHRTKSLRTPSGKKNGGQKGHEGTTLKFSDAPDHIIEHAAPANCTGCGKHLGSVSPHDYQRRQVYDIPPIKMQVLEHRSHIKCCPACGMENTGAFPGDVSHSVQYGNNLKAWAAYLVHYQLLPYGRSAQLIKDLTGHTLSTGTLVNITGACRSGLEVFGHRAKEHLLQSPVINSDETGFYYAGKRQWLHVVSTEQCTLYQAHEKRGREAMDSMGILGQYKGVVMHDYWKSYLDYGCLHALCNVHHLRDLTYCEEREGSGWATKMKSLLLQMKAEVAACKQQGGTALAVERQKALRAKYDRLVKQGYQQHPLPVKQAGKTGVVAKTKTQNLLERFRLHRTDILRFTTDFAVPFGNNLAEQAIRMMKVKQKISGCFRSAQGASDFALIRSYIDTLRKQGLCILEWLGKALAGDPWLAGVAAPG